MPTQHKAGSLKQQNKKHKTGSSKRAVRKALGAGKVSTGSGSNNSKEGGAAVKAENSRLKRINQSVQLRNQKKADVWLSKRIGSTSGPPKVVALVPLSSRVDTTQFLQELFASEMSETAVDSEARVYYGLLKKHRSKFAFIHSVSNSIMDVVEVARVADIVVFVANAPALLGNINTVGKLEDGHQMANSFTDMIDEEGHNSIAAMRSLGFPSLMCAIYGLNIPGSSAIHQNARRLKEITRFIDFAIMADIRILDAQDVSNVARQLSTMTCSREISWRAHRSYLVADSLAVDEPAAVQEEDAGKTVVLTGYLRGNPLYIHSLMHICGIGSARITRIEILSNQSAPFGSKWKDDEAASSGIVHVADRSLQDSLAMTASGDGLAGEQTWPSEEEIRDAAAMDSNVDIGRNRRDVSKHSVPTGMSSYQADWYLDETGNFDQEAVADEDDEGIADGIVDDNTEVKKKAERDDVAFPDEMDTPDDVLARVRFARYRALQSFRSSPWHPKENLPASYASIFEFEDFGGMQRRILSEVDSILNAQNLEILSSAGARKKKNASKASSAATGMDVADDAMANEDMDGDFDTDMDHEISNLAPQEETMAVIDEQPAAGLVRGASDYITTDQYVKIWLDSIQELPQDLVAKKSLHWRPCTAFSLLPHENKVSVLNYNIQRVDDSEDPIKCKDELLFMSGFRQFVGRPIFSEANLNCDKNKMERFLLPGRFSMATIFGPITYMPCPLLMFRNYGTAEAPQYRLVGTGSLGSVNPDRIILKKIVLTGFPIRVKKRFAVVRHMFHEPNDVRWFKPAELVTKHGLRGHITEPVGTHGLFKAQFNSPITQNDTVTLMLYKRVFPKFPVKGLELK